jgi:dolichol-phosphate mannosyltransferase
MNKKLFIKFVKFGIVGGSGIIVNSGVLWFGHEQLGLPVAVASVFAVGLAIFNNFNWNNIWTWSENKENRKHNYFQRLWRYYLSAALGAAINYTILLVLFEVFDIYYLIANLIGIMGGMVSNFVLGELWVFKSSSDHDEKKHEADEQPHA